MLARLSSTLSLARPLCAKQHISQRPLTSLAIACSRQVPLATAAVVRRALSTAAPSHASKGTDAVAEANKSLGAYTNKDVFAVVHLGGTQYKISVHDSIVSQKIEADVGSEIYLNKVLLLGSKDLTVVGTPLLSEDLVRVKAVVTEQTKTAKIVVFKKKRRKQYKRERGHRQQVTVLRITDIDVKPTLEQ